MKFIFALYISIVLTLGASAIAQTVSPTPAVVAPVLAISPEPVPAIVKDESMAPPLFFQNLVVDAKSLPVVGPYIVKIGQILLIVLTVLTALTAALASILAALKTVVNKAGFTDFADKVEAFQKSKFMYYLKFASLAFNAQKIVKADASSDRPEIA